MMKNVGFLSLFLLSVLFLSSCKDEEVTKLDMTADEKKDLLYMAEEEKLARDVYDYLYTKYELDVFKNIKKSEQKHMDKLQAIITKYGFENPVATEVGVFNNTDLQALYANLVVKGEVSLVEALLVGTTIEDVDIFDLKKAAAKTTNEDLLEAYDKLECGSRNHMRAFTKQLTNNNTSYEAQYISADVLSGILAGSNEQCGQ